MVYYKYKNCIYYWTFRGNGTSQTKKDRAKIARTYVTKCIEAHIPFYSPHLKIDRELISYDDKESYATALNHEMLNRCEILAVLLGQEESSGTKEEIKMAATRSIPIVYLDNENAI